MEATVTEGSGRSLERPSDPLPVGPLVYRRRLRAALEAEIGRLYLDMLEQPIPDRLLAILGKVNDHR